MSSATQTIRNPTYEEWSFSVEQELSKRDSISIQYVGNHTYHQPVQNNGLNAWNSGGVGRIWLPLSSRAAQSQLLRGNEVSSSAISNFNGGIVSWQHRARDLTVALNYQYSHALDEISNGGFNGFSGNSVFPDNPFNLSQNYGNADYDSRHYISGNYVYTIPHYGGPKVLVDNWQFSGTVFHSTGLPFSVTDGGTAAGLVNYGGPLYASRPRRWATTIAEA